MTFYNFLSSILSYVFTLIIYLFIFSVIRLIYLDVKKMSRFEDNSAKDSCDIVIKEDYISARHLEIWYEDGEWYLQDLGSRNGTAVNGHRIRNTVILDPEDVISVGGLNFAFEL